jgi:hypothetical protein
MYVVSPLPASQWLLPVIPCSAGHAAQAMETLLGLVTVGMTASTVVARPAAPNAARCGIVSPFR